MSLEELRSKLVPALNERKIKFVVFSGTTVKEALQESIDVMKTQLTNDMKASNDSSNDLNWFSEQLAVIAEHERFIKNPVASHIVPPHDASAIKSALKGMYIDVFSTL